jgi:distribution and morphology protein 10
VKRFSPGLQLQLRAVSSESRKDGGSLLGLIEYDVGKYALEGLAATDGGLLGLRGVYNFGGDASDAPSPPSPPLTQLATTTENGGGSNGSEKERIYGRFTAGGEIYYGTLNKSGGVSCGIRLATLPSHKGTPLTATVTLNPLVGSIAASYAIRAGKFLSLGSRLDFNVYSYDSNWSLGMEIWGKEVLPRIEEPVAETPPRGTERSFQAKLEWRLDDPEPEREVKEKKVEEKKREEPKKVKDEFGSMVKARFDQNTRLGLLWEGRVKSLLFSIGTNIDLRRLDHPFRTLGLDIQYSS